MPLQMIEVREMEPFAKGLMANVVSRDATLGAQDQTYGWCWENGFGTGRNSRWVEAGYLRLTDQVIWFSPFQTRNSVTQWTDAIFIADSQGIDTAGGKFRDEFGGKSVPKPANVGTFFMGQQRLEGGSQKIYSFETTVSPTWREYNAQTLDYVNSGIFPNFDPEASTIGVGNDGYYLSSLYRTNVQGNQAQGLIFFEGITNSTGYSEITDGGTNLHPSGLALIRAQDALQLSGSTPGGAWAWVDVATGNAVGILGIPFDTLASSNTYSEPNIDAHGFQWSRIEFVPDEDSLDAFPKGEIHCYSNFAQNLIYPASGQFVDGTPFNGFRIYVTVYDFNPFNLTTGPARTHNKRIFLGAIDIPREPSVPGGFDTIDNSTHPESSGVLYHKPSNSYFMWAGYSPTNPANDGLPQTTFNPQPNTVAILRWKRAAVVDAIVQSPIGAVTTNKTVRHKAFVYGEFGQRAAGVALTATLKRASTYEEQFTPASATASYTVAAGVIDNNSTLVVYEGSRATGTLLVEGTNYTVNYSTGTITGINFTASAVHSVGYQHRSNELTPPHGTLLNAQATSDANGVANFDVSYADDATLAGQIDSLTVATV